MTLLFVLSLALQPPSSFPSPYSQSLLPSPSSIRSSIPPSSIRQSYPCPVTPQHPAHLILCTDVQITLEPLLTAPEALTANIRATNIGSTSSPRGIIYTVKELSYIPFFKTLLVRSYGISQAFSTMGIYGLSITAQRRVRVSKKGTMQIMENTKKSIGTTQLPDCE
ncbi:hypothetical protein V8E51_012174 [Hyaloscypha variabilis]